jgi:hypothetical protein
MYTYLRWGSLALACIYNLHMLNFPLSPLSSFGSNSETYWSGDSGSDDSGSRVQACLSSGRSLSHHQDGILESADSHWTQVSNCNHHVSFYIRDYRNRSFHLYVLLLGPCAWLSFLLSTALLLPPIYHKPISFTLALCILLPPLEYLLIYVHTP